MNSDRFKKIEEIYHAALKIPSSQRRNFLEGECGEDLDLMKEIESMLSFEDSFDSFIDAPPNEFAAELISEQKEGLNLLNKQIGRYKIQTVLGKGGMGTVYLAQDTRLARKVALKVLSAEMVKNVDRVKRFIHEARSASALNHPHILTVYEIDEFVLNDAEKVNFISMEFVEGKTFDELIYSSKTSNKDLFKYLTQIARGLSKAHNAGIVHRDLKPENIMISNDGYAKILDFGLAKLTDTENELHKLQEHKSKPGVIIGTLGYMSPEQAQGKPHIDERSDIFSYGCILYEAIAKRMAFKAETTIDSLHKIIHSDPTPITDLAPNTSQNVKTLIENCLQKNPADRIQDIKEVVSILQNISNEISEQNQTLIFDNEPESTVFYKAETVPTISKQFSKQRRQVTVMFVEFAAFSELLDDFDPEKSTQITKDFWDFLNKIIVENNARISERLTDTFLAIWGTNSVSETDPEKSVRTALELQTKVTDYFVENLSQQIGLSESETDELANTQILKIAISTGTILVGNSFNTGEIMTTGSAVNVAKRLLSKTKFGEVFVSHDTYRHIRGIFDVEEVKAKSGLSFKSKKQTKIYLIKGVKPRAFRLETRGVEGIETNLIGRESELIKMLDAFDAVCEDEELQIVTVVGEAGLGKSRLLYEFQDKMELLPEKFFVFKARGLETMRRLPYSLIKDLFSFRFEILETDSQKIACEKFEKGILQLTSEDSDEFGAGIKAEMKAKFIGQLIGFDFSNSSHIKGLSGDEKQIQEQATRYAVQFFRTISQKFPVVLYLDDLHWADDDSLNFIDSLINDCADEAILLTEFTRPILFERRPHRGEGRENQIRLNLQSLTKRESRKLVKNILQKVDVIPKTLRDLLVSNTEGNPFYVEELIKMLIEQNVINTKEEKWIVDETRLGEISVPPTLTGVLQARLDKLSAWERIVLQRASVIGREFWDKAIVGLNVEFNLRTILESLREKELLYRKEDSNFEDSNEYIFKHALLRDVTYETVLLKERKNWHSETANWLIEMGSERENEYLAVIAEHFERSEEFEKSAIWFGKAGERARKSYALDAAENNFTKALDFWNKITENEKPDLLKNAQVMDWNLGLAGILSEKARFSEANEIYQKVLKWAESSDDKLKQAIAYWGASITFFENSDPHSSLENAKKAVEIASNNLAENEKFQQLLSMSLYRLGRALISLGKPEEAIAYAEKSAEVTEEFGFEYSREKSNSLHLISLANTYLGNFNKAQECEEKVVEISRKIGDKRTLGNSLNTLGFQTYMQGNGEKSIAFYKESLEIAREIGNKTGEIMIESNIGGAKVYLGKFESAATDLKELIEKVGDTGHFLIPETYRFLTEALIGQKKYDAALKTAIKSLELSKEADNKELIGEAWRVLGIVLSYFQKDILIDDQTYSARDCFNRSLEILQEGSLEVNYAQTLHNFAQHESSVGNTIKAKELLAIEKEISNRLEINTAAKSIYFL